MTRSRTPWSDMSEWLMRLVLLTAGSTCFLPAGDGLSFSPFVDPECTGDCSWTYFSAENRNLTRQFCEMISDSQDGLTEECHNPFKPSTDPHDRPGEPLHLKVYDFNKNFNLSDHSNEVVQHTCVNITYHLNAHAAEKVKGLQLTLRGMSGKDLNKYYCINLNFSQTGLNYFAVLDRNEKMANLSFPCFCGLHPGHRYIVTIRTMPVDIIGASSYNPKVETNYSPPACDDTRKANDVRCRKSAAALWAPQCISIKQDTSTPNHQGDYNVVEVSFPQAPPSFCFDAYEVYVYMYPAHQTRPDFVASMETASTVNGTCLGVHTTNVTFIIARFNTALKADSWPVTAKFYTKIKPVATDCKKCKNYDGSNTDCRRSFSKLFSIIEDPCKKNPCLSYGECISVEENYTCKCQPGYMFWEGTCTEDPCQNTTNVSPCINGECIYIQGRRNYTCHCNENYVLVGKACLANPCTKHLPQADMNMCGLHGQCNITITNGFLSNDCICDPGYSIQGNICEEDVSFPWIIMVIVVSCIAGFLLFIAAFRRKPCSSKEPESVDTLPSHDDEAQYISLTVNPKRPLLDPVMRKRRVLPIFSEDHPKHKDVVVNLCRLLQRECMCEVSMPDWCRSVGPTIEMWLTAAIEEADIILLLCSKGTRLKFEAKAKQTILPTGSTSEYGDVFVKALTLLDAYFLQPNANKKFVVAYFDYSSEDDIPATFKRFSKYRLMQGMEALYLRIHDKVRDSPHSSRRVPALDNYCKLETGRSLLNAIIDMKKLIKSDSLWYQNYNRRHSSNVSGYVSADGSLYHPRLPPEIFDEAYDDGRVSDTDFEEQLLTFEMMPSSPVPDANLEPPPLIQAAPRGQALPETQALTGDIQLQSDSGLGGLSFDCDSHLNNDVLRDSQV